MEWPHERYWQSWPNECRAETCGHAGLLRALAEWHGEKANYSALGRKIGVSCHAVRHRLARLEQAGCIRILNHLPRESARECTALPPLSLSDIRRVPRLSLRQGPPPCRRRLDACPVHRPRVFLRNPTRLLEVAGFPEKPEMESVCRCCLIDRIIERQKAINPNSRFYWWATGRGRRLDLIVETERERIGFQIRRNSLAVKWEWNSLRYARQRGLIRVGFLHRSRQAFSAGRMVAGVPFHELLDDFPKWIGLESPRELSEALREVNDRACASYSDGMSRRGSTSAS